MNSRIFWKRACGELTVWFAFLLAAGCSNSSAGPDTAAPPKPQAGTTLVLSCPDESLRKVFEPWVRVWAHESGARVTVSAAGMKPGDTVDVAILPAAELGAWAERGELAVLPNALREPGNTYQFSSVLPPFRGEAFIGWGNQLFAAPVASHAPIVVYRADRFADPETRVEYRKRFGRDLAAPVTWEEFADIAAFFAERDKRPSLPPLNASGLEDLFLRVAACHDRPALAGDGSDTAGLAFAFDLDTGKARLESLGFVQAARWIAGLKSRGCLPAPGDPNTAAELTSGRATLAIATLADLMQLTPEHKRAGRYGLAALPGAGLVVSPTTGKLVNVPCNRIPYLAGGTVGVVRTSCKNPEAAFALLAELTGPARSKELAGAGGFAPVRESILESDRLTAWLGYGFDEARTRTLQEAVRTNIGAPVRNPALGLRTPDEAELHKTLQAALTRILDGTSTPEAGLKSVAEQWNRTSRLEWQRRAAGLN
ncbi:MAG: extracellular solute-binding protein [Gemmataceae bacterium]